MSEIGYMMKCFYRFHSNADYDTALRYSFGFEGYIDNLKGVFENLADGNIHYASFSQKKHTRFLEQYYPPLLDQTENEIVKNDCKFDKNMIISAPNAAGKTTILKTTLINIIFSQQLGCGFYESCVLNPYTHIHSYLNIPDTSGRDSLFQAESRRCKEIIDIVSETDDNSRHFCIFDELYSGTNPTDAGKSASAFLKYLGKFENVNFMLTTHYVYVCKKFKKSKKICNYKMGTVSHGATGFKFTYKLEPGISKIQGAVKILKDMNYPQEMIDTIENSRSG
jgi:DNA mismatch repair ATPase MutS